MMEESRISATSNVTYRSDTDTLAQVDKQLDKAWAELQP